MDSCGEYFFFYGLTDFILFLVLAWRNGSFMSEIYFCLLIPGVLGFSSIRHKPCPTTDFSLFLFPLMGRRCHFRFRVPANHLASTFFLPVSGNPSEVTEYQHLLVSTLTHILYFDGLLLLIHAWGIVVILFLSSQWDTTWQSVSGMPRKVLIYSWIL